MSKRFSNETATFEKWLKESSNYIISPKISIADKSSEGQGRCVVAVEDINEGEVLFEIPRASLLNVATSSLIKDNEHIKKKFEKELGQWESLILCLHYEMFVTKDDSFWKSYLDVLPLAKDMNSLLFWTDSELERLKPSLVIQQIGKEKSRLMFETLVKFLDAELPGRFNDTFTWDNFVLVASLIMAYSFDVENGNVKTSDASDSEDDEDSFTNDNNYMKSMVPLADTLNADTHKCNANLIHDAETLKMTTIAAIKQHEQVYNIYGEHPNAELLRRYGYVEWDGSKYDFGEVPLKIIKKEMAEHFEVKSQKIDELFELLQKDEKIFNVLDEEEIVLDSYEFYSDGDMLPQFLVLLQTAVLVLQIKVSRNFTDIVVSCAKSSIRLIESGKLSNSCISVCQSIIEKRINEYPDISAFTLDPRPIVLTREQMAQKVLQCEVMSLKSCLEAVGKNYKTVNDSELLTSLTKRKTTPAKSSKAKRAKR